MMLQNGAGRQPTDVEAFPTHDVKLDMIGFGLSEKQREYRAYHALAAGPCAGKNADSEQWTKQKSGENFGGLRFPDRPVAPRLARDTHLFGQVADRGRFMAEVSPSSAGAE